MELAELKVQFEELLSKGFIRECIPMGSPGSFCEEKGWKFAFVHRLSGA